MTRCAAGEVGDAIEIVLACRGSGCSRKIARVITPSVPSAPVTSFGRS